MKPRNLSPEQDDLLRDRLADGRCLRFDSAMDAEALIRLIRAVETT